MKKKSVSLFTGDLKTYYSVLKKYKTVLKTVHRLRMVKVILLFLFSYSIV